MLDFLSKLFDTSDFPARWNCGQWETGHGWLHILSDLAIMAAYFAIPTSLLIYYLKKRRELPFPRMLWLFGAFIFSCGTTHLIEAIIYYHPIYRFSGLLKLITALVSWATVIAIVRIAPRAFKLPGMMRVNSLLQDQIERGGLRRRAAVIGALRVSVRRELRVRRDAAQHQRVPAAVLRLDVKLVADARGAVRLQLHGGDAGHDPGLRCL